MPITRPGPPWRTGTCGSGTSGGPGGPAADLQHGLRDARTAERWLANYYLGKDLGRASGPQISTDGAVNWSGTDLDPDMDAEDSPNDKQRRQRDREAFVRTLATHQRFVPAVARFLGLSGGSPNPTVAGRTWLCTWPTVEATADGEGTKMRNAAALVVAPPGELLRSGACLLLGTAWDLGAKEEARDLFATQLDTAGLRLSEAQRLTWGPAMHEVGKVYWCVDPAKPKKPRNPPKPKPEPPDPE